MNSPQSAVDSLPDIPGYSIRSIIGYGGFATVYLAHQLNLQRDVALKVICPFLAREPEICSRFLREARDTASVSDHPNIVTIHDVGQSESSYYIAMQYLEGPSLKQMLDASTRLPDPLELLYRLADALHYVHRKGYVHRDIKPANVLFNQSHQAFLSDFGIASLDTHSTQLTRKGSIAGTTKYMSPEQCRVNSAVDARSDLYSLGVLFFEVLTGRAPYVAHEPLALMLMHLHDPIPELPDEQKQYQPVIDRLMAKHADQRFQSARDLLDAIDQLRDEKPAARQTNSLDSDNAVPATQGDDTRTSTVLGVAIILLLCLTGFLILLKSQPENTPGSTATVNCRELTESETSERDTLLELASAHEAVGRWIHPPGANALAAYRLALEIDPCNEFIIEAVERLHSDQ